MGNALIRAALVQLQYHPALFADFRCPLEDPGGLEGLLPMATSIPEQAREHFQKLQARIRNAYNRQLFNRLHCIVKQCEAWNVQILLLPEYSIPWEILPALAHLAPSMVIVAGTHRVEQDSLECEVYQELGVDEISLPTIGQAVAPVLHQAKLLALVPKFHAAAAVHEELTPARNWQPVPMPEGIPGPMGVLICLDFLNRESPLYQEHIAKKLKECRFLCVPSWTSPHSINEFQAKAWEEAKRYGRPVLYADHANGGGTAFFVDEEKYSALHPYPKKSGCFRPKEEGVLIADIDLGYERPGGSTRYTQTRPIQAQAAASLVYCAHPAENDYAQWCMALGDELDDPDRSLSKVLIHLEKHRPLLEKVRNAADPTRRERLDTLLCNTRYIDSIDTFEQLVCELILPPEILPPEILRAAHIEAAKESLLRLLPERPALLATFARLFDEATKLPKLSLHNETQKALEIEKCSVRGRVPANSVSPSVYFKSPPVMARNEVYLVFRPRAHDFEPRLSPRQAARIFGTLGVDPIDAGDFDDPQSIHTPKHDEMDYQAFQFPIHHAQAMAAFSDTLSAEGLEVIAAVDVSRVYWMHTHRIFECCGPSINFSGHKIFLLYRSPRNPEKLRLGTYEPTFRILKSDGQQAPEEESESPKDKLDQYSSQAILDALDEWGIDVEAMDPVVEDNTFLPRFEAVMERFRGARETIREILERRLHDVDGRFVEPSLSYPPLYPRLHGPLEEPTVEPALKALSEWLQPPEPKVHDRPLQSAILLGEYGAGKSTLLAYWAHSLWEGPQKWRPILVDLAACPLQEPDAMLLWAAKLPDTAQNRAALHLAIRSGRYFPIFDGFDEMSTHITASELPQRLADLFDTAQHIGRVILSSRDHYFPTEDQMKSALDRALSISLQTGRRTRRFSLCFFSESQIRDLITQVTQSAEESRAIWQWIQSAYDLEELCKRPILLGMLLALRHSLLVHAPKNRGDIYEECLRRWMSQAGGTHGEIFTAEQKRRLAEAIALRIFQSGEPGIPLDSLQHILQETFGLRFFDSLPRTSELLETTGGMFLVRQLSDGGDRFRFAHKSLLEYFLASKIAHTVCEEPERILQDLAGPPLSPEIISFLDEQLHNTSNDPLKTFIERLSRWLKNRGGTVQRDPMPTAGTAANVFRLLLKLGQSNGVGSQWIPNKADLRGADFYGENLQRVRLHNAQLEGANFCGADLSDADLSHSNLRQAQFRGATLNRTCLKHILAEGADFSFAQALSADLEGADLRRSILRQSTWVSCRWLHACLDETDTLARIDLSAHSESSHRPPPWPKVQLCADFMGLFPREGVCAGAFRSQGKLIATLTNYGKLLVWDALAHRCIAKLSALDIFPGENRPQAQWAKTGDVFAGLDQNGVFHAWNDWIFNELCNLEGPFQRMALSEDGTRAALSDAAQCIRVIAIPSCKTLLETAPHSSPVHEMQFSPDGAFLALIFGDGRGLLYDISNGMERCFLVPMQDEGTPFSMSWTPDGEHIAFSAGDFLIQFLHLRSGKIQEPLLTSTAKLEQLQYSPSGEYLAGLIPNQSLRIWDLNKRQEIAQIPLDRFQASPHFAFRADERQLAVFSGELTLWNVTKEYLLTKCHMPRLSAIHKAFWSKRCNTLLICCEGIKHPLLLSAEDGILSWMNLPPGATPLGFDEAGVACSGLFHESTFQRFGPDAELRNTSPALAPTPRGQPILLGHTTGLFLAAQTDTLGFVLWDLTTGQSIAAGRDPLSQPIKLSPSGKYIGAMKDGCLAIWELKHDMPPCFTSNRLGTTQLWDWDSTTDTLIFMSDDSTLRSWTPHGGEHEQKVETFNNATSLCTQPRRSCIFVGHENGSVSKMNLQTGSTELLTGISVLPIWAGEWNENGTLLTLFDSAGALYIYDDNRECIVLTVTVQGDAALARTSEGYFCYVGDNDEVLCVNPNVEPNILANLRAPLGELKRFLNQPEQVAAALKT